MIHPPARALAGVVAAGILLAGCSSDPDTTGTAPSPGSSASATSEASTSASPSTTLTAEEQRAFDEATQVVLAYRQTLVDLYSGARTRLNDLNNVATGGLLDRNLTKAQEDLGAGQRSEPQGAQVELVSAEPVRVDLKSDPNTVVVRACIDGTQVTSISPDGTQSRGVREQADYTVTRTTYLPAPGWAVARTQVAQDPAERTC
jgi:hypothetical protein